MKTDWSYGDFRSHSRREEEQSGKERSKHSVALVKNRPVKTLQHSQPENTVLLQHYCTWLILTRQAMHVQTQQWGAFLQLLLHCKS